MKLSANMGPSCGARMRKTASYARGRRSTLPAHRVGSSIASTILLQPWTLPRWILNRFVEGYWAAGAASAPIDANSSLSEQPSNSSACSSSGHHTPLSQYTSKFRLLPESAQSNRADNEKRLSLRRHCHAPRVYELHALPD